MFQASMRCASTSAMAHARAWSRMRGGSELFRIVQADNAPLGIENHRGRNDRTKQRAASGFINAGDTRPAKVARGSLETGGAESAHYAGNISTRKSARLTTYHRCPVRIIALEIVEIAGVTRNARQSRDQLASPAAQAAGKQSNLRWKESRRLRRMSRYRSDALRRANWIERV